MNEIAFQKALASVMLDNKYDRFVKNRKTGKLDTKSLYKINTSNKLFKKREARQNKDYAVSLVVDCSSSMSGERMEFAAEAAAKLSHHLGMINITHNVVAYGLGSFEAKPFSTSVDKKIKEELLRINDGYQIVQVFDSRDEKRVKNRKTGHDMQDFVQLLDKKDKNYSVRIKELKNTVDVNGHCVYSFQAFNGTSIGEAIKFSREALLKQKGKKLMIFLTDGDPCPRGKYYESPNYPHYADSDFDPKHEIDLTLHAGIEYYGIGVMDDSINSYSPQKRTASIRTMKQLYPHILHLIKINLKRG